MTRPPQRTYDRTCAECEKPFTGRRSDAKYCTDLCAGRARYRRNLGSRRALARDPRKCLNCGNSFTPKRSDARFCSKECGKRFYYEENRERSLEFNRQWAKEHPEQVRATQERWRAAHPGYGRKRYAALKADPGKWEARQEYHRQWYQDHREEVLERVKERSDADPYARLYYKHGTDWRQLFAALWEAQDGKCYLCGDELHPELARAVHLDHDHRCCPKARSCEKCRRGLACADCNRLIGCAKDDPKRLRRIADNLERAYADVTQRLTTAVA